MPETPTPAEKDEADKIEAAERELLRWREHVGWATDCLCIITRAAVGFNEITGKLTMHVGREQLTAAQMEEIKNLQKVCPDLTIDFKR